VHRAARGEPQSGQQPQARSAHRYLRSIDGWWKYGVSAVVGIDTYGESAPAPVLFEHFGFTPRNVADTVLKVLQSH
jgi:transketolase